MLQLDLKGKIAFIAGVGDDQGYGWAIAKALAEAGATILLGTWTPMVRIFTQSWEMGKFDESRQLKNGSLMTYAKLYALDAAYDSPQDVPQDVKENKRYQEHQGYTISEVAAKVGQDFGKIDILVHSLANGPEVKKQAEKLIDAVEFDFVGTDCHRIEHLMILEENLNLPYFHKIGNYLIKNKVL
jgi:enoyl-[acyl-carrier protein] reductase I